MPSMRASSAAGSSVASWNSAVERAWPGWMPRSFRRCPRCPELGGCLPLRERGRTSDQEAWPPRVCRIGQEEIPDREHFLAGVLQRGHHAVAHRAALRREGGERGHDPLAELAVWLVRGQERDLVQKDHNERVFASRAVVTLLTGQRGRASLHTRHGRLQHLGYLARA
jgi:hypothetical protein